MMLQVPTPPTPPFDPNLLFFEPKTVLAIVVAALCATTIILWPIMRALARRLESRTVDPALRDELAGMRHRLVEVDALQARVSELEERLDFAERLLAQGQQTPALRGRSDDR